MKSIEPSRVNALALFLCDHFNTTFNQMRENYLHRPMLQNVRDARVVFSFVCYWDGGLTQTQIAGLLKCTPSTIFKHLQIYDDRRNDLALSAVVATAKDIYNDAPHSLAP